jgi:CysZ protein
MTDFFKGISDFFVGCRIICTTRGLWPYVWLPLVINAVVYAVVVGLGVYLFVDLMALFLPTGDAWYVSTLRFFGWIIFSVVIGLGIYFTFFVVAAAISSPFNERLSAKYEELLTGRRDDAGLSIVVTITQEVKRLIVYIIIFGVLVFITSVISFIPFINLIVPALWLLFVVYVSVFEFLSYMLDRKGLLLGSKLSYMKSRFLRCGGFGLAMACAMFIPVVNIAVIPSAVIGATHLAVSSGALDDDKKTRLERGRGFNKLLEESSGDEVRLE